MPDALLYVLIAIAVLIVLIVVLRTISGRSSGTVADDTPPVETAPEPVAVPAAPEEGDNVTDGFAAAVEDVAGEFIGVEAHPDTPGDDEVRRADDDGSGAKASTSAGGHGDTLVQIKGLGPKAAKGLKEMGIVRFEQIAGWTEGDIETVGEKLGGTFAQRIERDRWVEQAGLLARGETEEFEKEFGKLG